MWPSTTSPRPPAAARMAACLPQKQLLSQPRLSGLQARITLLCCRDLPLPQWRPSRIRQMYQTTRPQSTLCPMHLIPFAPTCSANSASDPPLTAGADSPPRKKQAPGVTRIGAPAPRLSSLARSAPQPASSDSAPAAQGPAATEPAVSSIGQGPQLAPSEQPSAADRLAALIASADAARPASPAVPRSVGALPAAAKVPAAAAASAGRAAQSGPGSARGDKAYNAAVLAGAETDEAIARNIADSVRV